MAKAGVLKDGAVSCFETYAARAPGDEAVEASHAALIFLASCCGRHALACHYRGGEPDIGVRGEDDAAQIILRARSILRMRFEININHRSSLRQQVLRHKTSPRDIGATLACFGSDIELQMTLSIHQAVDECWINTVQQIVARCLAAGEESLEVIFHIIDEYFLMRR